MDVWEGFIGTVSRIDNNDTSIKVKCEVWGQRTRNVWVAPEDIELITPTVHYNTGHIQWIKDIGDKTEERKTPKYPIIIQKGNLKLVFNPPYTIAKIGSIEGKAKCHPNDVYDPIEGLKYAIERWGERPKRA